MSLHKPDDGFRVRRFAPGELEELVSLNDENVRAALGVPTKAQIETSASGLPAFMCDPFITEENFLQRTRNAQAILVVAFATGAMPDRLVPAISKRISEGVPVFVLSNNPGSESGILKTTYAAGKGAYDAGAVPLQKVNVNHHLQVKVAILHAIDEGLQGHELAEHIRQMFSFQPGEKLPYVQIDDPDYVLPPEFPILVPPR